MTHRTPYLALVSLLLFAACDTEEVAPLTSAKVRSSLRETARTHARDGARLVADFLSGGFADVAFDQLCPLTTDAPDTDCAAPELDFEQADADEAIDDFVDTFFADDRVVSETATEVIYSVDSTDICHDDVECNDLVSQLGIQLVASQPAPNTLEVIVRSNGHNVFVLVIDPNNISLELDLAELSAVVADHPDAFDLAPQDVPTASGRIRAAIERISNRRYRATLDVTQAIAIQQTDFSLSIDAATVLSIDADADAESLVADVGLDRVSARFPASLIDSLFFEMPIDGTAGLELGGLTASADLANVEQRLDITNLSLGQTTSSLSLDGVNLFAVDLNEMFGRELDLTVEIAGETFTLSFDPAASARADIHLQPLADQGHEIPQWALDVENRVLFTAAQGRPAISLNEQRARVENGTLEFSTDALADPVTIEAGLCIEADDTVDVGATHPFAAFYGAICE